MRDREVTGFEIEEALTGKPPIIIEVEANRSHREGIGDTCMPFGKYEGYPLRDLPEDYLQFLLDNLEQVE